MRAFYRIKRTDWPLTREGEDGPEGWYPDCVEVGGTSGFVIVHSATYPNPELEDIGAKFLCNSYKDLRGTVTKGQADAVFRAEDEGADGIRTSRKMSKSKRVAASLRRENIIPHAWGARESVAEQKAVDG